MTSQKFRAVFSLFVVAVSLVLLPSNMATQAQELPADGSAVAPAPASSIRKGLPRRSAPVDPAASSISKVLPTPNRSVNSLGAEILNDSASSLLAQKPVSFRAHRDYLALSAGFFAQADLNGDGITDLVLPAGGTNISVLLGNRDGSFRAPRFFNTDGNATFAVAISDFNGDGNKDVAVTSLSGVSVLLGDGKGNFGTPKVFAAGASPGHIVAGDFNGDTKVDLAVTNFDSNDVSIFLGKGDGTFTAAGTHAVGEGPLGIAVGDFNHDGHVDLVVANSGIADGINNGPHGNTLAILLGTGKGGFRSAAFIPVKESPNGVAVSDFNNDTKQDVVVTNIAFDQVSELLGSGDGTFQSPRVFTVFPASGTAPGTTFGPSIVSVDDFNGDGNMDLAVANSLTSTTAVLLGDGKGGFGRPLNIEVGRTPISVLTGDYNHDGKQDFITVNADAGTVSVVFGKGDGTFLDATAFPTNLINAGPAQIVVSDFNNDGIPDVATANSGNSQDGHTVSVLLGEKGGRFARQEVFDVGNNPAALATGDFNNDGRMDLVVANAGFPDNLGSVSLLLGNGDGTFRPAVNFDGGALPDSIGVADFNGDGNKDVVVGDFGGTEGLHAVSLLLGDGKGSFGKPRTIISFDQFAQVLQVATGDFNGDGKADIAYINGTLSIQLGNGDGTFQPPKTVTVDASSAIFSYSVGDFNRDGIPDFAVEEGGVIEVLLGDGKGNFKSAGKFSEGEPSGFSFVPSLVLADFNGDGFLDVAAPDGFSDNVSILLGNGDGTLGPATLFAGGHTHSAVVADFNGDFRPDIALATTAPTASPTSPGEVIVLLNNTPSRR